MDLSRRRFGKIVTALGLSPAFASLDAQAAGAGSSSGLAKTSGDPEKLRPPWLAA